MRHHFQCEHNGTLQVTKQVHTKLNDHLKSIHDIPLGRKLKNVPKSNNSSELFLSYEMKAHENTVFPLFAVKSPLAVEDMFHIWSQ